MVFHVSKQCLNYDWLFIVNKSGLHQEFSLLGGEGHYSWRSIYCTSHSESFVSIQLFGEGVQTFVRRVRAWGKTDEGGLELPKSPLPPSQVISSSNMAPTTYFVLRNDMKVIFLTTTILYSKTTFLPRQKGNHYHQFIPTKCLYTFILCISFPCDIYADLPSLPPLATVLIFTTRSELASLAHS